MGQSPELRSEYLFLIGATPCCARCHVVRLGHNTSPANSIAQQALSNAFEGILMAFRITAAIVIHRQVCRTPGRRWGDPSSTGRFRRLGAARYGLLRVHPNRRTRRLAALSCAFGNTEISIPRESVVNDRIDPIDAALEHLGDLRSGCTILRVEEVAALSTRALHDTSRNGPGQRLLGI